MTKKQAGIIAVIAFAALMKPIGALMGFATILWCSVFRGAVPPLDRLLVAIAESFGWAVAKWASVLIGLLAAAIPALLIYFYLRRRDFTQVCADCSAHRIRAWSLFVAFLALTVLRPSVGHVPVQYSHEEIPLDEAMENNPTATLELRLCHPENERLVRELKANGRLTDEVLAAAPQIEGYSLMRVKGDDDSVCYVSSDSELTMDDFASAKASESSYCEGNYEVSGKLTPDGRGRLARLTHDYKPHGAKNPSDSGRALAIIVNDELVSAPVIQSEIDMGEFVITGRFTREEAVRLAAAFNARNGNAD